MRRLVSSGNTLTEYGLLIGLLALTSVAGLKYLGNSTSTLLSDLPNSQGVMQMMSLDFNGSNSAAKKASNPVKLQGGGYYTQTVNRYTGEIEFRVTSGNNGNATNTTSLDGSQWNTLGQFQIAETLMQLANKQTDPQNKAFITRLAEKAYYMGAAEGEIDAVEQLQFHDPADAESQYGKTNGLEDIKRLQKDILSTLNTPPKGLDPQTIMQVNALSLDVYNIGQSYANVLKDVSTTAKFSFILPTDLTTGSGKGVPGQSLTPVDASQISYCPDNGCGKPQSQGGPKVEQVFTIDYLRTVSKDVMSDAGVAPEPVVATFTDATRLDNKASTTAILTVKK